MGYCRAGAGLHTHIRGLPTCPHAPVPQYGWCMSYCMLVEVNTWMLIAKRTLKLWVLEVLFYVSWVLLRNIFYP